MTRPPSIIERPLPADSRLGIVPAARHTKTQMQTENISGNAAKVDAAIALPPIQNKLPTSFINFEELKRHVPLCERSLREAVRRGQIPSIRLPGGRRVVFHWDSVQAALLRMQCGEA